MIRWIVINRTLVETIWFTIGSCGLAAMIVINILLLQRLIQADYMNKDKNTTSTTTTTKNRDNKLKNN